MAIARAILEIVTDASGVQPGIDKTEKSMLSLSGVAGKLGGLMAGAFAVTEIVSAAAEVVNFAGDLTDLHAKTGLGVEALQELKYAGGQVGVELETITGGVTQLQKRLAGGDASAVGAIKALGLNFDDLRNKKPEDQFKAIAAEVAKVEDPADRVKLAMDLFGKSGAEMLPLLTDEFIGLTEKANSLGIVMDEETVASMDTLGDTVGDLMNVGTALIAKVLTPFIPLLTQAAEVAMWLAGVLGDGLGWAVDKIGEGLKWLSLQAISGLRSLLSMGQGITEMFPTLSGAIGLTDGMTNAMALLDSAEQALTTTKDAGTAATERASVSTRKLNLDYAGTKKEADAAAKAQQKLNDELQKAADVLTGRAVAAEMAKFQKELALANTQGGISVFQMGAVAKKFEELRAKGAEVPPELQRIAMQADFLNRTFRTTKDSISDVVSVLPGVSMVPWGDSGGRAGWSFSQGFETISMREMEFILDQLQSKSLRAEEWGNREGWSFSQGFGESFNDNPIFQLEGLVGQWNVLGGQSAEAFKSAFSHALEGLGELIVGAFQGGGNIGKSIGASLLGGLGQDLGNKLATMIGGSLGKAIGGFAGPLGSLLGGALGSAVQKIFSSNDTKKDREAAARMLGFSSLSAMNDALNKIGPEGQKLVHEGLNVIGKKDTAANNAWIANVKELFDKQKEIATKATEDAAKAQADNLAKITDPLKARLADIDAEYQKLSDSIAKEAPEEIMGVIEAQERAALADLEVQRKVTENELKAAEGKVLDTATVIRDGVEKIFEKPITVTFDFPQGFPVSLPGGAGGRPASYGGAMADGGVGHVTRPTWFLAGERPGGEDFMFSGIGKRFASAPAGRGFSGDVIVQVDGYEIARAVVKHQAEAMENAGF